MKFDLILKLRNTFKSKIKLCGVKLIVKDICCSISLNCASLQFTMKDLYAHHKGHALPPPLLQTDSTKSFTNFCPDMADPGVMRTFGGDRRLAAFGYTLETITMLLVPMVKTE